MAVLPRHVALVSEMNSTELSFSELTTVSAAISKQVARDFSPIWEVNATVDPFPTLEDVPPGYWPVIIQADIGNPTAAGFHTDRNGNPFALVQYSASWSLTASHETLEMLADPFGNRVVASLSPFDDKTRVEILVEVCDPSEDAKFSYTVDGVVVSDFYTPHYLDPVTAPGVRYGFGNALEKARQLLKGGYISFHDLSSNHWMQMTFFGAKPELVDLGELTTSGGKSIREQIDRLTRIPSLTKGLAKSDKMVTRARTLMKSVDAGSNAKAAMWRAQIKQIVKDIDLE
jgi:hypothetical protein